MKIISLWMPTTLCTILRCPKPHCNTLTSVDRNLDHMKYCNNIFRQYLEKDFEWAELFTSRNFKRGYISNNIRPIQIEEARLWIFSFTLNIQDDSYVMTPLYSVRTRGFLKFFCSFWMQTSPKSFFSSLVLIRICFLVKLKPIKWGKSLTL